MLLLPLATQRAREKGERRARPGVKKPKTTFLRLAASEFCTKKKVTKFAFGTHTSSTKASELALFLRVVRSLLLSSSPKAKSLIGR